IARRLDAVALGAVVPELMRGELALELAQRWTADGAAPGAAASYQRRTERGSLDFRLVHAPGGSRAFARARDEFSASASRSLSRRTSLHGSYWRSVDDGSVTFGRLRSGGAAAGASHQVSNALSITLSGHHHSFATDGETNGFDSRQTTGALAAMFQHGSIMLRLGTELAEASRITRFDGMVPVEESGPRRRLGGPAGVRTAIGNFGLSGRLERNEPFSGAFPRQSEVTNRASGIPLATMGRSRVVLGGS